MRTLPVQSILLGVVGFQWWAAALDPHGYQLGGRFIALILLITALAWLVSRPRGISGLKISPLHKCLIVLYLAIVPWWGSIVALLRGGYSGSSFDDTSYYAASILFLSSIVYCRIESVDRLIKAVLIPLFALGVIIPLTYFAASFESTSGLAWVWVKTDAALLGFRTYEGITLPYIYFYASPMLFIAFCYCFWRYMDLRSTSRFALVVLVAGSIFLSGTRANQIGILLCIYFSLAWRFRESRFARRSMLVGVIFVLALAISWGDIIEQLVSLEDTSNSKKVGYLKQYREIFDDFKTVAFGQGFNSVAWSPQAAELLVGQTRTELTYLEFGRVFGVPVFLAWIISLIVSLRAVAFFKPAYQWLGPALLIILVISFQNPYIFSTNGMLLISLIAAVSTCEHRARLLKTGSDSCAVRS